MALRAAGAGLNVFIGQFNKSASYSEITALARFEDRITVEQLSRGILIWGEPAPVDVDLAAKGLARVRDVLTSGRHDVVILDEANVACACKLITESDLVELIDERPPHVEMIITGRRASPAVLEKADLVSEVKPIRHYLEKGVAPRKGIES